MDFNFFAPEFDYQPGQQHRQQASSNPQPYEGTVETSSPVVAVRRRRQAEEPRRRGRPRVNPQDQTATERRRTQIRLAQRAYRQRKETTISGLKKRVDILEKTVQHLNRSFLDFHEQALAAGIQRVQPELAARLQTTADEFSRFTQDAQESDEEPSPPPEEEQETQPEWSQPLENMQMWNQDFNQPFNEYPQMFRAQFPDQVIPSPKAGIQPGSLAHHESSFTRRLMRDGVERAISTLLREPLHQEAANRVFRLTATFISREKALWCLSASLKNATSQSFELWNIPRYHIGGAGLHFPRKGIDANSPPPAWWGETGSIGPFQLQAEQINPKYVDWDFDSIVRDLGMEGEWFDPNDVEEYLKIKGLDLNASSSIVEVREPDTSDLFSNSRVNLSHPVGVRTDREADMHWHNKDSQDCTLNAVDDISKFTNPIITDPDSVWQNASAPSFEDPLPASTRDLPLGYRVTSSASSSSSNANTSQNSSPVTPASALMDQDFAPLLAPSFETEPSFLQDASMEAVLNDPLPRTVSRPKKFVDVDKFVDLIMAGSVCLGRTAGFRRQSVDQALRHATIVGNYELDGSD